MGKDGQPKHRQAARELLRRKAQRQPAERLLIVCEGAKTEPLYLGEIRQQLRLPSANVQVQPAIHGTEPLSIVEYAERLFTDGQRALGIHTRSFDRVVVVFDRDEHHTYHTALQRVAALSGRLENDERVKVPFEAVVSVPCFELWLLLHFEDVFAPLHRDEALARLRAHVAGYAKGRGSYWAVTRERLDVATARTEALQAAGHKAEDGTQPYTNMHALVHRLLHLKDQAA
ncbi:MAG: RloB domain-containing protein [Burkholderiales bacterium]|nr:RloB domain-containing protein [Burkholderiales bacterium]